MVHTRRHLVSKEISLHVILCSTGTTLIVPLVKLPFLPYLPGRFLHRNEGVGESHVVPPPAKLRVLAREDMSKRPRTAQHRVVFPPFSRIYVRCGLLSAHQLRQSLTRFGDIAGVSKHEGDHRKEGGYAFVQFRLASAAARCCEAALEHIDDEPVKIQMAGARSKKGSKRRQKDGGGAAQSSIVMPTPASIPPVTSTQVPHGTSPSPNRSWLLVTSCASSIAPARLQQSSSSSSSSSTPLSRAPAAHPSTSPISLSPSSSSMRATSASAVAAAVVSAVQVSAAVPAPARLDSLAREILVRWPRGYESAALDA